MTPAKRRPSAPPEPARRRSWFRVTTGRPSSLLGAIVLVMGVMEIMWEHGYLQRPIVGWQDVGLHTVVLTVGLMLFSPAAFEELIHVLGDLFPWRPRKPPEA